MADNTQTQTNEVNPNQPVNIFSLFTKFIHQFPFFKPKPNTESASVAEVEPRQGRAAVDGGESSKPDIVRFPKAQLAVPPPVAVYALGGFLVLKWVLARWKERKGQKDDSSDEDQPPAE
ncbi:hypothetical protein F8388_002603 [Cannabis sativa]|uniref:Uncharacterized protein n=1 Tax=Cannabis sativa TaxID=3483 RepID=A0A7J6I2J2_CANSA|nr:hypothetical protein F8388_002603 [Cannabis sativa]KAF4401309.1 hypothetical protein G4B88_014150 [Cannabis sativa]